MRLLALVALLVFAGSAAAQDLPILPISGDYTGRASWDPLDYAQVCFERVDTGAQLGCSSSSVADTDSPTGQSVAITFTLLNEGVDVGIKGYAEDAAGNQSQRSSETYIADFTAPTPPVLIP